MRTPRDYIDPPLLSEDTAREQALYMLELIALKYESDLPSRAESFAFLLQDVFEGFVCELADLEMRGVARQYFQRRRAERRDDEEPVQPKPPTRLPRGAPLYDYGEHAGVGAASDEEWARVRAWYDGRQGNTNYSNPGGPPLGPLHSAGRILRQWWTEQYGPGTFKPRYGAERRTLDDHVVGRYPDNEAAALLLALAHWLDSGYLAENCSTVAEKL